MVTPYLLTQLSQVLWQDVDRVQTLKADLRNVNVNIFEFKIEFKNARMSFIIRFRKKRALVMSNMFIKQRAQL